MGSIIGLAIAAAAAYWVFTDAKKNNIDSGALWAVFTFFILIIGLPVYLWKRSQHLKAIGGGQGQLPPG
jgi:hypothetical protein